MSRCHGYTQPFSCCQDLCAGLTHRNVFALPIFAMMGVLSSSRCVAARLINAGCSRRRRTGHRGGCTPTQASAEPSGDGACPAFFWGMIWSGLSLSALWPAGERNSIVTRAASETGDGFQIMLPSADTQRETVQSFLYPDPEELPDGARVALPLPPTPASAPVPSATATPRILTCFPQARGLRTCGWDRFPRAPAPSALLFQR